MNQTEEERAEPLRWTNNEGEIGELRTKLAAAEAALAQVREILDDEQNMWSCDEYVPQTTRRMAEKLRAALKLPPFDHEGAEARRLLRAGGGS